MRIRRLQRQDEDGQWYDDAYVTEDIIEDGIEILVFHYNLTWDRVGSAYNEKLQEAGVPLDEIETVLQAGETFRWQTVEIIPDDEVGEFLKQLNEECAIPTPQPIMPASLIVSS